MGRVVVVMLLAACGGGGDNGTTIDAPTVIDAPTDGAAVCTTMMCGATCCASAAQNCTPAGGACECPAEIVPQPFSTVIDQMDTVMQAPDVLGIGVIDGTDGLLHALVIGFEPVSTPLDTDIALPTSPQGNAPFVGIGYDVDVIAQTTRSTLFASQGTLRLSRRCAAGVAGSITGLTLREQTTTADPTPHPMGCTLAVPDLVFDFGSTCP